MLLLWTVAGLPVHPLIVHAAVVLVPLSALAFLAIGWRDEWRRRYCGAIAWLAAAGAIAAILADLSGKALQSPVRRAAAAAGVEAHFSGHLHHGDRAAIAAVLFAVAVAGVWVLDVGWCRSLPRRASRLSYSLAAFTALAAVASMVAAGHSGAALVWKDVGSYAAAHPTAVPHFAGPPASAVDAGHAPSGETLVRMTEFAFQPDRLQMQAGAELTVQLVNDGKVIHTFNIVDLKVASGSVLPGQSISISFTAPPAPRRYLFVCTEEGHEEEGMIGTLVVE